MHIRPVRFTERNGGLHPAAHFCVKEICIFTNNVVSIKYRNDSIITIYKFIHHYVLTQYFFHTATTFPPIFALSIKYLPKTSPLFAAIHLFISSHDEIKDFCSMDKKTGRRYVLCLLFYT